MSSQQPLSILLVEDEECAVELIHSMLTMAFPQANIYCAADGKAGLDCFRAQLPDVVITDINMPEMDGVAMLAAISAIKPDTRIVVVTAITDRANLEKVAAAQISYELIAKPIDFNALFAAITDGMATRY